MVDDGLDADGGSQVRLAGAGPADQHDVLGFVQELAAVQRTHQRLVDSALFEVEAGEIAVRREAGHLHLVVDRAHLPFGHFGLDQALEHGDRLRPGGRALFGQRIDGTGHSEELQRLQRGDHAIH